MIRSRVCSQILRTPWDKLTILREVHTTSYRGAQKVVMLDSYIIARRKKNIEKELKRHEKHLEKELRPVEEYELPTHIIRDLKQGLRIREIEPLTEEQKEHDILLDRKYYKFCAQLTRQEKKNYQKAQQAQAIALEELKNENYDLFLKAVEPDETLLSSEFRGPTHTPPIPEYLPLDGLYTDMTNYFTDMENLTDLVMNYREGEKKIKRKK